LLCVEGSWLRDAAQVVEQGAQAVARGGARCASRLLDRDALADARVASRCFFFQVLDRGAQVVAAAATLLQQEKNNSTDAQRKRVNFTRVQRRTNRMRLG
jgi:hypothetical protein